MNLKRKEIFTGVLLLALGIIFIIAGIFVMKQGDSMKQRCTEKTTGTVVELISERDHSSDGISYVYYPVIQYQVGDRTISQKSRSGQNPPQYSVGQQVEVYYNPNNVEEFFIEGDSTTQFIGIIFIGLGSIVDIAVVIFVFIGNAIKSRKLAEAEAQSHTSQDGF